MAQFISNSALSVSSAPSRIWASQASRDVVANISINNSSGNAGNLTLISAGAAGSRSDHIPAGVTWYIQSVSLAYVDIVSDASSVIAIDVSGPEFLPPQNLTITGGSVTASLAAGSTVAVSSIADTVTVGGAVTSQITGPLGTGGAVLTTTTP
jgi:hypothetical protein